MQGLIDFLLTIPSVGHVLHIFYEAEQNVKLIEKTTAIEEMGIIFWLNFDHVNFYFGTFILL